MSKWNVGEIKKTVAKNPITSTLAYAGMSFLAMKLLVDHSSLITFMGAGVGAALSAIPATQNSDLNPKNRNRRIAAGGIVGLLLPGLTPVVAAIEGFQTSRLLARRGVNSYTAPSSSNNKPSL